MGPDITLERLALSLNRVPILAPMSGHLAAGRLHAIIGPNGAGKSSLMKCLLGLHPHQGEITRHWPGRPGRLAYVPQLARFEPSLPITVEEFMLTTLSRRPLFGGSRRRCRPRIEALLARVGMEQKLHLRLGQLSGGERQRLLFAQGLERDSALWFLDEPMTGLDNEAEALINREITALKDAGATLLVIHHDMNWVRGFADQAWLIDGGLSAHGRPQRVLSHYAPPALEACA
ncbi:metal ABC transporter ATP-binding protein [Oceanimonas pelagia]|uniref:Metal ABC transporter ATP-binding protein n=1 Tax=Oceanimonas pelagia TaxID=3028314 RepID=A0AA50KPS1_9GAMM|nr:metal ABC transporter ATP-binding protein [Oceanimonas pelagia]WMC10835.1 metal ABC transporter ATP-binding protein [Oceanimonas pelagia]